MYTSVEQVSTLFVNFALRRHMGYFVINIYIPCSLLVAISWVGFWINREATSDRITLGTSCSKYDHPPDSVNEKCKKCTKFGMDITNYIVYKGLIARKHRNKITCPNPPNTPLTPTGPFTPKGSYPMVKSRSKGS